MTRTSTLAGLALISLLATPVVVGTIGGSTPAEAGAAAQIASAAPVATQASAATSAASCVRRVKVIYAGYGEASRAACTTASAPR